MAKGPLLFQSDQEIELYRKQTEVELARLPLRRFENEATQARLPTYALWAMVLFGAVAFLMQFINTLPTDEKSWGRNFLMVVVGALAAFLTPWGRGPSRRARPLGGQPRTNLKPDAGPGAAADRPRE